MSDDFALRTSDPFAQLFADEPADAALLAALAPPPPPSAHRRSAVAAAILAGH